MYRIGAAQLTGQLTLNAQGNPQAVFIFQVDSTLVTASDSSVVFINGASPCNVFWKVGSSATIGTDTDFVGTIMAQASIAMNTGATLQGRALARTAAVTLDTNTITRPVCSTPSTSTSASPTASPTVTHTATPTGTPTATPSGAGGGGLPITGSRLVPILMGTGSVLIVLGGIVLFLFRRRTSQI